MERTTPITLYLGCFDDKVAQFPWVKRLSNRDLLTSIAHQILLGRQSFVTDAHLFLNPQIYRDVLHDDNSALRYLVNAGQIRIPRRTKTFRALIEEQQQAEILSFKAMSPETIEDIERLDEQMSGFGRNLMGPPSQQIWRGFDLLAQEFSQKPFASLGLDRSEVSEDSWKRFVDVFQSVNPHERRSRKQWEAAIDATEPYHDADLSGISTRKRRLMNIGNEIYHINYSAVLASHFDENVGVETAFSARTLPYFDADANDTLSDVGSVSIMKIADPASILDMKFLPELLDHVSVLGQARMNFVSELLKFEKTVANIKVLKEAGDEYSRRLNERIFSQAGSTRVEVTLTLATLALGIVGGAYLAGPLGSVGLPCLLWIADRYLPMRVTKPLLNKSVFEFAFDQPRNARVGKLAIAASRLDPEFVDRHIGSIERTGSPIHVAAKHADRAGPAGRAVDA